MKVAEKATEVIDYPVVDIEALKRAGKVFRRNEGASIVDTGDRIGLVEFHTKANSINRDVCEILAHAVLEGVEKFDALVIGNNGKHFSAGANLFFLLESARNNSWKKIEHAIRLLQITNMTLKYSPIPVIATPFSSTLGGGCEICLHSSRVVAAEELYMGLVETGVGLIPAGGGAKELGLRALTSVSNPNRTQLLVALQKVFNEICTGKVSRTGTEAKKLFLSEKDVVVPCKASPLEAGKKAALELVRSGFRNGDPNTVMPALGKSGFSFFQSNIRHMLDIKVISNHDAVIALHVATILCGGDGVSGLMSEHHFLDLEREAFLSLLGTVKTQERIEYLLKNNKPLRN